MILDPTNDLTRGGHTQGIFAQSLWITLCGVLLFASLFSTHSYASEIYTWVDEQGVTHFSQEPPEQKEAKKIYSEDIQPAKIGSVAPTVSAPLVKVPTELEKSALAIKKSDKAQAKTICESAKHSLNVLSSHSKLNRKSADTGKTIAMTEEQRQAAITEQKERVSLFCEN
ncbi:DUF4124 domain-containing protein [Shewanella gelidimarina]|uniref:DUF4124 domain-containing protein n=1 Tax=Shewanella gelidimarina TaxID=56813 RepID=UPI00200D4819|nr:DUF4124 domain-containing protein [Shewanella gelidimarina]MCL1059545.1 DUF4124 domain-containing protein [Shewanella gelidimarina]